MALKLPPEAHNQSPLFGALWAIFMIRGPSKFILQKYATQKSAMPMAWCGFTRGVRGPNSTNLGPRMYTTWCMRRQDSRFCKIQRGNRGTTTSIRIESALNL